MNESKKVKYGEHSRLALVVESVPEDLTELMLEAKKQGCDFIYNKRDQSLMPVNIDY